MIKIQDQVWAVKHVTRAPLAYMCQVTKKADGRPDNATEKMMTTGRSWAGKGEQAFYDNVPVKGFKLGDSVSRWHTQNKLFRVLDPRGFEVEVPTGNISALLSFCTVVKGVVQEECVWGREDGSHILLPVNSPEYTEAKKLITKVETGLIKPADLKLGDRVKLMSYGNEGTIEYVFLGIVKLSWMRQSSTNTYKQQSGYHYWANYSQLVSSTPLDEQVVKDDKWVTILAHRSDYVNYNLPAGPEREASRREFWRWDAELNPKILSRTPGELPIEFTLEWMNDEGHYNHIPDRVKKKFTRQCEKYESRKQQRIVCKDSIVEIQFK